MLSFEPIQLMQAIQELQELHIHKGGPAPELNAEYIRLFRLIGRSGLRHTAGWSSILTQPEILLLCRYVLEGSELSGLESMTAMISSRMDHEILRLIYIKSQDYYRDLRFQDILQCFRTDRRMCELFYQTYGYPWEGYLSSIMANNPAAYANGIAGTNNYTTEEGYFNRLKSMGIVPDTLLYRECAIRFITVCNGTEYIRLGADELKSILSDQSLELQISTLKNMLHNLDSVQLRSFFPILELLMGQVGDPCSRVFKKMMSDMTPEEIDQYQIWLNQYRIVHTLKDYERSSFWLSYTKQCRIRSLEELGAILFRFKDFTVIEFASPNRAAYFYDNQYMEEVVNKGMIVATSEAMLEEWLHQHTEWSAQGEYKNHWRKAHREHWQTDMRDYILQRNNR